MSTRTMDVAGWSDMLGVHNAFLEEAMREKLRRIQHLEEDARALFNLLKTAPDDELVLLLRSANHSLAKAAECMQASIRQISR